MEVAFVLIAPRGFFAVREGAGDFPSEPKLGRHPDEVARVIGSSLIGADAGHWLPIRLSGYHEGGGREYLVYSAAVGEAFALPPGFAWVGHDDLDGVALDIAQSSLGIITYAQGRLED